jgi:hypothetical protein
MKAKQLEMIYMDGMKRFKMKPFTRQFLEKVYLSDKYEVSKVYKGIYYSTNFYERYRKRIYINQNFTNGLVGEIYWDNSYLSVRTTTIVYDILIKEKKEIIIYFDCEYINDNQEFRKMGSFIRFNSSIKRMTEENILEEALSLMPEVVSNKEKLLKSFK